MDLLLLGSILVIGGMLGLTGLFDGGDDSADTPPQQPSDDAVYGGAQDDSLTSDTGFTAGWGGNDTITANGDAEVWGNAGNDRITTDEAASAHGGTGDDTVEASGWGETIWGDDGNDEMTADGSAASYGGAGEDSITSLHNGPAYGDGGNDSLSGDTALYGGDGNDLLNLYSGQPDYDGLIRLADGGAGDDTIWANETFTSVMDDRLATGAQTSDGLTGGDGNDLFLANATDTNQTIHDFTAGADQLGFVVAAGDTVSADNLTITSDTVQGFTDVTYATDSGSSTLHLDGVTNLDPTDILFVTSPTNAAGAAHIVKSSDGNDSLSVGSEWDLTLHGGDGNDTVSGFFDGPAAYGDAGNDVVYSGYGGAGDDTVTGDVTSRDAHGDDGNDVLTIGGGAAYGGAGNDSIHDLGHSSEGIRSGTADGGDGNDTIIGIDSQYKFNDPIDYAGGAGDDHLAAFSHQALDAGSGNDVVISERSQMSGHGASVTLGDGDDILALQPNVQLDPFAWDTAYTTTTVTDFDPVHDTLALIMPQADLANLNVVITPDTAGGFTDVTLHDATGDLSQTYRLEGVTALTQSDIQLFQDQTAADANQPYGTVDLPDTSQQATPGPDTFRAFSGNLSGGDGNDTLTLSGDGTLSGDAGDDSIAGDNADPIGAILYGGAGNDTANPSGQDTVYGDAGNDLIDKGPGDAEFIDENVFALHGPAYGGAGDDTITGSGETYADQGDDLVQTYSGTTTEGGDGNDILIIDRSEANAQSSHITLGAGQDTLALDPVPFGDLPYSEIGDPYALRVNEVTDFDPAQDHLALIIPQAQLSDVTITLTPDLAKGYTDLTLGHIGSDAFTTYHQTWRLLGVTTLTEADIALYTDDAAVIAGTPWQQGIAAPS